MDQVLAQEDVASGEVLWQLADNQGTSRDVVDSDGAVATHLAFEAFGALTAGDASATRYQFTGREWDADLGLYYYRARWYDPEAGRFISEDPIGFEAGDANLRRYVGNDPPNFVDPDGLEKRFPTPSTARRKTWSLSRAIWAGDGYASDFQYRYSTMLGGLYTGKKNWTAQDYEACMEGAAESYANNPTRDVLSQTANVDPTGVIDGVDGALTGFEEGQSALEIATGAGMGLLPGPNPKKAKKLKGVLTGADEASDAGRVADKATDGVDLDLKFKRGWTEAQREAARKKTQALSDADTVVVKRPKRSGTSAASRYRKAGKDVPAECDVDHTIDLQLNGPDDLSNMAPLDKSVNRSLGSQINKKTKKLPEGTRVNNINIHDR